MIESTEMVCKDQPFSFKSLLNPISAKWVVDNPANSVHLQS